MSLDVSFCLLIFEFLAFQLLTVDFILEQLLWVFTVFINTSVMCKADVNAGVESVRWEIQKNVGCQEVAVVGSSAFLYPYLTIILVRILRAYVSKGTTCWNLNAGHLSKQIDHMKQ